MAAPDLAAIVRRLSRKAYLTQEVIFGAGEAVQPSEYTSIGASRDWMAIRIADRAPQGDVQE